MLSAVLDDPVEASRLVDELVARGAHIGGGLDVLHRTALLDRLAGPVPTGAWPSIAAWDDPADEDIDAFLVGGVIFHRRRGDLVEAAAFADSLRERLEHRPVGDRVDTDALMRAEIALTEVLRGRFREAAREAERALRIAGREHRRLRRHLLAVLALAHAAGGELNAAADAIARAEKILAGSGWLVRVDDERLLLARALMAVERADPGAGRLLSRLSDDVLDELWPLLLLARARWTLSRDDGEAAAQLLDEAVPSSRIVMPGSLGWDVLRSQRFLLRALLGKDPEGDGMILEETRDSPLSFCALLAMEATHAVAVRHAQRLLDDGELGAATRAELLLILSTKTQGIPAQAALQEAAEIVQRERLERLRLVYRDVDQTPTRGGGSRQPVSRSGAVLSRRERVVLARIAEGDTVEEAAATLRVSANTVKTQLKSIYRRLGVASRTEAIAEAARRGIIDRVNERPDPR
ncbi:helix-turn-helix transcriptional regulator [Microbacterium binotii]|uniref:helix-turn-helix transcriptional regulator n=1 Tax=Microbacterium binotii TaxID=462710 RepID=UPI001F3DBCDD|nr:LuxR C-terminal-related transcriptional regulator [Microbacterium binotii]UIN30697.1 LuxR C-terminal-related transcriptional regulator [Microbacterium binotii]